MTRMRDVCCAVLSCRVLGVALSGDVNAFSFLFFSSIIFKLTYSFTSVHVRAMLVLVCASCLM